MGRDETSGEGASHNSAADERNGSVPPRLRAAHKLEAIGSLASGLAHEINNPIQSILNYAHLIRRRSTEPNVRECADEITHEAQRVAAIVRNLQSFVQEREEIPVPMRIDELVTRACKLFGAGLQKEGITVEERDLATVPEVMCSPRAIEQVIVNLLMSARDALNDRHPNPAGSAAKRVVLEAHTLTQEGPGAADLVRLTCEDYGTPIRAADVSRVFTPFAALPGRDQGAGLGLAVSYDIARANGGALSVEHTADGELTRFHLDLPIAGE